MPTTTTTENDAHEAAIPVGNKLDEYQGISEIDTELHSIATRTKQLSHLFPRSLLTGNRPTTGDTVEPKRTNELGNTK